MGQSLQNYFESMEQSPSWETVNHPADQEITHVFKSV
jgi:hypothetical protein